MRGLRAVLGVIAEFVWLVCLSVVLTVVVICAMLDSYQNRRGGGGS